MLQSIGKGRQWITIVELIHLTLLQWLKLVTLFFLFNFFKNIIFLGWTDYNISRPIIIPILKFAAIIRAVPINLSNYFYLRFKTTKNVFIFLGSHSTSKQTKNVNKKTRLKMGEDGVNRNQTGTVNNFMVAATEKRKTLLIQRIYSPTSFPSLLIMFGI